MIYKLKLKDKNKILSFVSEDKDSFEEWYITVDNKRLFLYDPKVLSFYLKKITGRKIWRGLHYIGFVVFFAGMAHGITSGSDSALPWMQFIYWLSAASVLFFTAYRLLMRSSLAKRKPEIEKRAIN